MIRVFQLVTGQAIIAELPKDPSVEGVTLIRRPLELKLVPTGDPEKPELNVVPMPFCPLVLQDSAGDNISLKDEHVMFARPASQEEVSFYTRFTSGIVLA